MTTLAQLVAVEQGIKTTAGRTRDDLYKAIQRTAADGPLHGMDRRYRPLVSPDEGGVQLPGSTTRVQLRVDEVLAELAASLTRMWDLIATKDNANCGAFADIVVDGQTLVEHVPVTTLMTLEKQLVDVRTFISHLPILDPAEDWQWNEAAGCWASRPVESMRMRKVPESFILVPPTKEHPAQAQRIDREVPEGMWTVIKYCGAMQLDRVKYLLARVETLINAVRVARQGANTKTVENVKVAGALLDYVFAPVAVR